MAELCEQRLAPFAVHGLPMLFLGDFNTDQKRGDYPASPRTVGKMRIKCARRRVLTAVMTICRRRSTAAHRPHFSSR